MPPVHASSAVSPVTMHMVMMNAPKKNMAKPSENKKNLAITASIVSVKHLTVKNQCLPIDTGKIRAMLQCIKTFPSKIKGIDFTRGNPNGFPYSALSDTQPVQCNHPYDEGRRHYEGKHTFKHILQCLGKLGGFDAVE